jgi:hypothetical protein
VTSVAFSPDGKRLLTGSADDTLRLWDAQTGRELCTMVSFADSTWAVFDRDGRFDGSNEGNLQSMHWVRGFQTIPLIRLRDRFYEPGLLAKHMGLDRKALRQVPALTDIALVP